MPRVGTFFGDVILTGRNDKEHLENLHEVLKRLQTNGLKLKKEKCTFFADSVTYLGYIINKEGIHTDPKKIKASSTQAPISHRGTRLFGYDFVLW